MLLLLLSRVRALDLRPPSHHAIHLCDRELTNSTKKTHTTVKHTCFFFAHCITYNRNYTLRFRLSLACCD